MISPSRYSRRERWLIGAPALFQVVLHIDYRDNLVWCEYEAKK